MKIWLKGAIIGFVINISLFFLSYSLHFPYSSLLLLPFYPMFYICLASIPGPAGMLCFVVSPFLTLPFFMIYGSIIGLMIKKLSVERRILWISILVLVTIVLLYSFYYWASNKNTTPKETQQHQTVCTQETKQCPDGSYVGRTGPNCEFTQCPIVNSLPSGWKLFKPDNYSFEFQYPETLNTKYASFMINQYPAAGFTYQNNDTNGNYIDGCFVPAMDVSLVKSKSNIAINNMQFCVTTIGDVGAGQQYNTYYYTTLRNGIYYTLNYPIHTLNGCGAYMGTSDYQPCLDFFKNYDTIVIKPIQDSVATLKFTK